MFSKVRVAGALLLESHSWYRTHVLSRSSMKPFSWELRRHNETSWDTEYQSGLRRGSDGLGRLQSGSCCVSVDDQEGVFTWEWPERHSVSTDCLSSFLSRIRSGRKALLSSPDRTSATPQTPTRRCPRWRHEAYWGRRRVLADSGGRCSITWHFFMSSVFADLSLTAWMASAALS